MFHFPLHGRVMAQAFNDLSGQPEEIRQAVEYCAQRGYMEGFPDGGFHPDEALTRLDCARALVCVFGHAGEGADPSIRFTDLPDSHPGFIWANLAVKHGLMDRLPDGTFQPSQGATFERVAIGVAAGTGMNDVAGNVDALTGGRPPYGGAVAVFMGLRCKYRYSRVWPGQALPRGEMAYALYRLDHMESWRKWYLRDTLSPSRCTVPHASEGQLQALGYGFERLGCPYVYGGERESEGGFGCSGFVYNTRCIRMGYPMKRVADDQARDERYLFVARAALQSGDAVFFYEEAGGGADGRIGHAGMYVGNGMFIHSTGSAGGVSLDCLDNNDYWRTHFAWGRRVVGGPYNDRFDTWLLLYNPGPGEQRVDVRFMRFGRAPDTGAEGEWIATRPAFWGAVACGAGMVVWLTRAGLPLGPALLLLAACLLFLLVAVRVVCQGGITYFTLTAAPLDGLTAFFGSRPFTAAGLAVAAVVQKVLFLDLREALMPALLHARKVSDGVRHPRRVAAAVALCLALGAAASLAAMLAVAYKYGIRDLSMDWALRTNLALYEDVARLVASPAEPGRFVLAFVAAGAAVMLVLVFGYHRFYWWPIHPIGYLTAYSSAMAILWFSFFVGWLANALCLRYAGLSGYRDVRLFFVGLIVGDFFMAGNWALYGLFSHASYLVLPE